MATKAEKKAQQAEDFAKWRGELLTMPGIHDVGGVPTCAACSVYGHAKKAFPMESRSGEWLTPKQSWESHQRVCFGARPQEQEPPTKAEKKAQQAEDFAKWLGELLTIPGIRDVDGVPTCAACAVGGYVKRAFPMQSGSGEWLTPKQSFESHQRVCWGTRPQEQEPSSSSPPNPIRFVPAEGADSEDVAIHDDDDEAAPDWRKKAALLLMQGVGKQSVVGKQAFEKEGRKCLLDVRIMQLGNRDKADKDWLEHSRKHQLADLYGQSPWYHNALGSDFEKWLRPRVSPVRPLEDLKDRRRHRDRSREERGRYNEPRRRR